MEKKKKKPQRAKEVEAKWGFNTLKYRQFLLFAPDLHK